MRWLWMIGAAAAQPAGSWELVVELRGVDVDRPGMLRCALFKAETGFPMDPDQAWQRVAATPQSGRCVFTVPAQRSNYAVAVGHDEDGDERVKTNLLGIPREGWATSNDVRPTLRAPTFAESSFEVAGPNARIAATMRY